MFDQQRHMLNLPFSCQTRWAQDEMDQSQGTSLYENSDCQIGGGL